MVITSEEMKDMGEGIAWLVQEFSCRGDFDQFFTYGGEIESPDPLPLSNYLMIQDVIHVMKVREKINQNMAQLLQNDDVWPLYFEDAHVKIAHRLSDPVPAFITNEIKEDDVRCKFLASLEF